MPSQDIAHLVTVAHDHGAGIAAVRSMQVDPASQSALWIAPHAWSVSLRVHGELPNEITAELLDRVDDVLAAHAPRGEAGHAAVARIAARDTALVQPLLRHGYAPATVTAVRTARPPAPPATSRVRIRDVAGSSDRDRILELATELDRYDSHLGTLGDPPDPASLLAEFVDSMLAGDPELVQVAETSSGEVIGYANLQDPQQAAWITNSTTVSPAAYLGQAYVDPRSRSAGVGAALMDRLHDIATERGWEAILLDYTAPNPLSGPFWSRMGYRPLYVSWQRRPAHPARWG